MNTDPLENNTFASLDPGVKSKLLKAKSLLVPSLGDKTLRTVAGEWKNPFGMYETLQERYATQNTVKRVQIPTKLYQKSFNWSQTISEYVDEFDSIFNQLEIMEGHVSESIQTAIFFASFGSTSNKPYGAVTTAL